MSENLNDKYRNIARIINRAGVTPFPITDTLLDFLKHILKEDELDLIFAFKRKSSQTLEQLKQNSKLSEDEILKKINILAKKGVIYYELNLDGIMVYQLIPFGYIFSITFMRALEPSDYYKKLADLYAKYIDELRDLVQDFYDTIIPTMQKLPPTNQILSILKSRESGKEIEISINEELEVPVEEILSLRKAEEIIEKYEIISVGNCYCRNHKDLLNNSCKINAPLKTCISFGKFARFRSEHGLTKLISKGEALKILKETEEAGLIHRTLHFNFEGEENIYKDITGICNCCKCCCIASRPNLIIPMINATNYLAKVNQDSCKGSGICVERCPYEAIQLNDHRKAEIKKEYCLGCGVCASFCPESAISLLEGPRIVRIPPPRRTS